MVTYEEINRNMPHWGFPVRYIKITKEMLTSIPSNIFKILDEYIDNFKREKTEGLYLFSEASSTGKTSLAVYVVRELIFRGKLWRIEGNYHCQFWDVQNLVNEMIRCYETNEGYNELIDRCHTSDILVLDDLGKEKISEHSIRQIRMILKNRYDNLMPIIVTSNYLPKKLKLAKEEDFADVARDIKRRLNEMTTLVEI